MELYFSGGINVKRIFILTAAMLVWGGSVVAGDLKVMVPVDELKQMKSRLEALEKENSQLKGGASAVAATPSISEMESRLLAVESENNRLRQEVNAAKGSERPALANAEMQARLETVERENRQLKEAQARQGDKGSTGSDDVSMAAKLNVAETENIKLQQEIKSLKDGGLAAVFAENKVSAREQYFQKRRKGIAHTYKF
jgi:hypothetical protein